MFFQGIDGYESKSTNSDLAGFYLLLYIRQHAGLFRRRTIFSKGLKAFPIPRDRDQDWDLAQL
jgi:hypothetical protein